MAVRSVDKVKETGSSCRRRTYFISGFDPRGVAYYQGLFKRALKQRGWRLGRRSPGELITLWHVEVQGTELAFLHWDDVARDHWPKHPFSLLRQLIPFGWDYVFMGRVWVCAGLVPGVALCGLSLVVLGLTSSWRQPPLGLAFRQVLRQDSSLGYFFQWWCLARLAARRAAGGCSSSRSILFMYRLGKLGISLCLRVQMLAESLI